ncbi:phage/plasmid replication protein, II/X family, partial [Vibrio anguillarum]|uniref:phage/plasmid replication protein, II/X family n=1 Tax=Vibrio anguillarum TaxID=55601 RepID=UPI0019FBECAF
TAAVFITTALKNALPEFSEMLDFNLIDVFRFDATHTAQLQSRDQLQGALESLTRVSHKYLRPSRQGEFESTVYFTSSKNNPNSGRTTSLCIYSKLDEVLHQLEDLKARKRRERTTIYDKVIDELSSDVLNDFATNR